MESAEARDLRSALAEARSALSTLETGHDDYTESDQADELQREMSLNDLYEARWRARHRLGEIEDQD